MPSAGGKPRLLAANAFESGWSPTSDRLVAVRAKTLLSIELGSGRIVELRRGAFLGWSFSPDGERLAYSSRPGPFGGDCLDRLDLYVQSAAGGSARRLTSDGRSGLPVWGPGWIAFTRLPRSCLSGFRQLWLVRPDGRSRHRLAWLRHAKPLTGYYGLEP